jgi:CHAT domain-containing protein
LHSWVARWIRFTNFRLAGNRLSLKFWKTICLIVFILLLLIFIEDTHPGNAQALYSHIVFIFQQGNLAKSQQEAEEGYKYFRVSSPGWAFRFQLLQAETMVRRGLYNDALQLLKSNQPDSKHQEETIRQLTIEADALTSQLQLSSADQTINQLETLCKNASYSSCGYFFRVRGILAVMQGNAPEAKRQLLKCLSFARTYEDHYLEASASLTLGWAALQINHYDEALIWSKVAYQLSLDIGAENLAQAASGNLGWAYFQLGDDEKSLELFIDAEKLATKLGNLHYELKWISNAGYVYHDTGDSTRAAQSYQKALDLAKKINSQEDIMNSLEDLAEVSVEIGKLDVASTYLDQVAPMVNAGGNRLTANIMLTQGMLAAARHQDQQAEKLFRAIQNNSENPTTTRLGAGDELAKLFEQQGNTNEAERTYKATLAIFESARAQLKHEDSRLPFAANATSIYDHYIHLLVEQGHSEEALAAADQSRAQTLAQGLGMTESKSTRFAVLNPRQIAQSSGATLLFYWLGAQHFYLWAITPDRIALFPLPAQKETVARVERYRRSLLDGEDPQRNGNEDGQALYQTLVAPAAKLIRPNSPVMILADGALSQLNFETLLAPGPGPMMHYWINDQTLLSAPSLELLAAARLTRSEGRKLLLMGNPVTPSPDYPSLPHFESEISQISHHFSARSQAIFTGEQATPAAYLASRPAQFSYIHFVSHATASRTDPLDSAIILSGSAPSGSQTGENSFKLYAREIIEHPIDARLVTISACNGSGTRAYAGEGLVGLSWAFLRAGAHNVIGALWEVSDDSTPRLMDALYQGLQDGQAPSAALRNAKLGLLHSKSRFSAPFYWAPFQIYTRR